MKHKPSVTGILVMIFLLSQFFGLFVIDRTIDHEATDATGNVTFVDLPYNIETPDIDESFSWLYITLAILFGTVLVLILVRFRKPRVWKFWYLISVVFVLSLVFAVFMDETLAFLIALVLGVLKVLKPNVYLHNITEVLMYSGIALIFVPIINVFSAVLLLLVISVYDMIAVWKSKHMVKLAEFQRDSKVFAGLSIPYSKSGGKRVKRTTKGSAKMVKSNTAVLGGGDMAFPLLFTGALLKYYGGIVYVVPVFSALALLGLFMWSKKGRYYPAMPFISAGCFTGWLVVLLF